METLPLSGRVPFPMRGNGGGRRGGAPAAFVGKGVCFDTGGVSIKPGMKPNKQVIDTVSATIETMIGKIARPKRIHVVPDMPKTRSGKIMRRVLAAISNRMHTGDITTLANPDIVEQIRELVQGRVVTALQEGPADIKLFGEEQ